jgi:hypothetical protein
MWYFFQLYTVKDSNPSLLFQNSSAHRVSTQKVQTRKGMLLAIAKRTSLLYHILNYTIKKLYNIGLCISNLWPVL